MNAKQPPKPSPSDLANLRANFEKVRARIGSAALAAGRTPADVQLLPVTKSVGIETLAALLELGEREFGENRADALVEKSAALAALAPFGAPLRWHFLGPLQRNKVRRVVLAADVLHSVDSLRLIEALVRVATEERRSLQVYLQVWLSGETEKHGFEPEALPSALEAIGTQGPLQPIGLMTMGPLEDPGLVATRRAFERLAGLARDLEASHPDFWEGETCRLSMGMSGDLECAVASGSTLVRIGTDLFR